MISYNKNTRVRILFLAIIIFSLDFLQHGCRNVLEDDIPFDPNLMNPSEQEIAKEATESIPLLTSVPIPNGFNLILTGTGVNVYRKAYTGGQPDFVTVLDLRNGSLMNLIGVVQDVPKSPNDKIWKKSLKTFWNDAKAKNTKTRIAKVIVNGTFFSTRENPTPIAFGLKVGGKIISYGYGLNEFPGLNQTLSIDLASSQAMIDPYMKTTFDGSISEIIGALDPTANKGAISYVQRTFIGVRDDDGNGTVETVFFYSSKYATQNWALNILKGFGATKVAMLDGGGSTGIIINGISYITPGRSIPHAIAIYSGK